MSKEKIVDENKKYEHLPSQLEKVSIELSCELNDVEWQNRARELADAHKKTESQKQRKKDVMADLNADLKMAETQETKLANIVATKREQREVIVEVVYDYVAGFVTNTRTDTNEVISRREMTTNERQSALFDHEGEQNEAQDNTDQAPQE